MPSHLAAATVHATVLGGVSNVLAQLISAYRETRPLSLDILQVLRFVTFQLFMAPLNYKFQALLEYAFPANPRPPRRTNHRRFDIENPEKAAGAGLPAEPGAGPAREPPRLHWPNTMAKWFLDCISLGTFFNTVAFLVVMGLLKGQSAGQIGANVREETAPVIFAGYRMWPIASFISFTCVPLERRIAWLSLVGLIWGVYLSLVAERV